MLRSLSYAVLGWGVVAASWFSISEVASAQSGGQCFGNCYPNPICIGQDVTCTGGNNNAGTCQNALDCGGPPIQYTRGAPPMTFNGNGFSRPFTDAPRRCYISNTCFSQLYTGYTCDGSDCNPTGHATDNCAKCLGTGLPNDCALPSVFCIFDTEPC
jgi:hypothetical protein